MARLTSSVKYFLGDHGNWFLYEKPMIHFAFSTYFKYFQTMKLKKDKAKLNIMKVLE